ncbi:tetratricopeptide repeat protein [Kordiimonas gwangyangensis]|uniref:tetratricopeptide repeat protein n=1 Tax=Kordiimonas gwangyangensis TaxID=288022 RepID=UPI00036E8858|nr:CDC27 family protein [Kordiimonas gwangyangensis]
MNMIKTIKSLPMAVAAAAILAALPLPQGVSLSGKAFAQEEKSYAEQAKTRKVPAMSLDIHKKIQKAQEAMDLKEFGEAKEILNETLQSSKINEYEKAVAWQLKAMISYEEDNTAETIRAYEEILKYSDSIPVALELNILYGLAQLYYSEENYKKALEYIKIWEPRTDLVSVNQLVFIAQVYYTLTNFETSLEYIYRAISEAQAVDTVEVKESWYGMALSAHWELGQFTKVRDVLEILLINWPKPQYWIQLAGVYQELGDEKTSYSLTEAAYKQGFLDDKPVQLVNVAQIMLARGAPIKCAWVLEKAFKEDRVEKTPQNYKTLGQCYLMATEYEKALKPLSAAAKSESDGDLWFQIGQVQMQLTHYKDAINSFDAVAKAFEKSKDAKEKDKRLTAIMQKGQAQTELKLFKEAHETFDEARKIATDQKDKRMITQWRNYLKAEEAREEMLKG